jgi:hypothetical protein
MSLYLPSICSVLPDKLENSDFRVFVHSRGDKTVKLSDEITGENAAHYINMFKSSFWCFITAWRVGSNEPTVYTVLSEFSLRIEQDPLGDKKYHPSLTELMFIHKSELLETKVSPRYILENA